MPRFGVNYRLGDNSVVRFAYARFRMPLSNLRDTLGDFVNQYTGFAQTTNTLGLFNGRPQQVLNDPYPVHQPGAGGRRVRRSAATPGWATRSASISTRSGRS